MTEQNQIAPPPEMVQKWMNLPLSEEERLAIAYRAGADAELNVCVSFLDEKYFDAFRQDGFWKIWHVSEELHAVRRPKSL